MPSSSASSWKFARWLACLAIPAAGLAADGPSPEEVLAARWGKAPGQPSVTVLRDRNGAALIVEYQKVGDLAVFQGDMVLGRHEDLQKSLVSGASQLHDTELEQIKSKFPRFDYEIVDAQKMDIPYGYGLQSFAQLWPRRTIPYDIAPGFDAINAAWVEQAIAAWNATGAVRFVLASSLPPAATFKVGRVRIQPDSDSGTCVSGLGRGSDGRTIVQLGAWCTAGIIVHELGHALGLVHEHLRPDRDKFMTVDLSNVTDYGRVEIDYCRWRSGGKLCEGVYRATGTYDLCSIMHYGSRLPRLKDWLVDVAKKDTVFELTPAGQAELTKCSQQFPPEKCRVVGQDCGPSQLDMDAVKALYEKTPWPI